MGPQSLVALHRLQAVESKLRALKDQLRRKDRQLHQHRIRIQQLNDQLVSRQEEIKQRKTQISQSELDFKTKEVNIGKLRAQLNIAKNNKEYSAILTQLNTDRADNSKLEERILEELTAIDKLKASLDEMEKNLEDNKKDLAGMESEFQEFKQDLQQEIDKLENEHSVVAEEVPHSDLQVFQRVADAHEGEAMAKIVKPDPREMEYICDGCNMSIPMEKVNALLTRDEIQLCNICGRILFWDNETSDSSKR
jgi:predicted  nucleic acid-binding Zn-ribbon protein